MPSNFVDHPHYEISPSDFILQNSEFMIDGRSPVHTMQEVLPDPWVYSEMTETRLGCVLFSIIHLVSFTTACENASMRSASGQQAMCAHVSPHTIGNWGKLVRVHLDVQEISSFLLSPELV